MSHKFSLGLIAVMLLMGIVLLNQDGRSGSAAATNNQLMLPGLKSNLAELTELSLSDQIQTTSLRSAAGVWQIDEKFNRNADFAKVSTLVNQLAKAKLLEAKTKKTENFARLGVADGSVDAVTVNLVAAGVNYQVLIGDEASQRQGRYVRVLGENADANQVWVTDIGLQASAESSSWLDSVLLDVAADTLTKVRFDHGDESLIISRTVSEAEAVTWLVEDLPEDAELLYPSIGDTMSQALVNLRLKDIKPASEVDFSSGSVARFDRVEGDPIELKLVQLGDKFWLLNLAEPNWAYEISSTDYDNLSKRLSDLVAAPTETTVLEG